MSQTKLLIDADYFVYRAASTAETELDFNPDLTVVVGDFTVGKRLVEREVNNLKTRFDSDDVLLCFTDRVNFRKTVDPSYKGNRTKRKPAGFLKLKNWAMETWPSLMKPGLEADDVLGILATNGSLDNFVLISPDKDMQQIPCRIYDLKNEYTQTPELAQRKLWEQTLTGDSTDGYSGCPTFGPKRAGLVLDKVAHPSDYWQAVLECYESVGLSEEDALRNLRLARILQVENWDTKAQEPILIDPR